MGRLFPPALSLIVCSVVFAQDAGKAVDTELVKHWEASKALSLAVADAMPEESYSFKATDAEKSFGEQINHIATANAFYCSSALGTKGPIERGDDNTKAVATQNLIKSYDYCIDGLKNFTDSDLQKTVPMRGSPVTRFELFWGGFTHAAHHRGQAEVYLRLKGIIPPAYKF